LDANLQQQDLGTACLPPGHYRLIGSNPDFTGGQLRFGVTRGFYISNGPNAVYIPSGTPDVLPFDFYAPCMDGTNSIDEVTANGPAITLDSGVLHVRATDGQPLGTIDVLDLNGRLVRQAQANTVQFALDLHNEADGAYLVRVRSAERVHTARVVLAR
jgi:hypothetical protein